MLSYVKVLSRHICSHRIRVCRNGGKCIAENYRTRRLVLQRYDFFYLRVLLHVCVYTCVCVCVYVYFSLCLHLCVSLYISYVSQRKKAHDRDGRKKIPAVPSGPYSPIDSSQRRRGGTKKWE